VAKSPGKDLEPLGELKQKIIKRAVLMESTQKSIPKRPTTSLLNQKFGFSTKFVFYPMMTGAGIAFLLTIILTFIYPLLMVLPLAVLGGVGYLYFQWTTTRYMITDKQIILFTFTGQESILIRSITKIKLDAIQGFPVGSIKLETAAQSAGSDGGRSPQGDLVISNIENVHEVHELIVSLMQS
jgi:hypothetical protein